MDALISKLFRPIDRLVNGITMYKLVFYELLGLLAAAALLGVFGLVHVNPVMLAFSTAYIFVVAFAVNRIFAWAWDAPSNPESTWITALILALIISPPAVFADASYLALAGFAAAFAMASKYVLAIRKKHLFNPAALGVAIPALFMGAGASWWVGTPWMLPFVLAGGLLIVRKIRRLDLMIAFVSAVTLTAVALTGISGAAHVLRLSVFSSAFVFLGTVMLTEPLTTPPTRFFVMCYGALVGFLFMPDVHFGSFYFTPELALLAGNVFSYVVSQKTKLVLTLVDRVQLSRDTYEFVFRPSERLRFAAGQYLEWTLAHGKRDGRGIRRYFTISSAPEDEDIRVGVKFYDPSSSYKKALRALHKGDTLVASQLAGDFTLPGDKKRKVAFVAGGIGITPFASMLRHLLATGEKRDVALFYGARTPDDLAYGDLLGEAQEKLGIPTYPVFSDGVEGYPKALTADFLRQALPDYQERTFYLSGPRGMVTAYADLLEGMGVPRRRIKEDFFPGFA